MQNRLQHRFPISILTVFAVSCASLSPILASGGNYVDSSGTAHAWHINEAHTLIWDGKPYIPVGGMFCPRYFVEGQTEANWDADLQSLQLLKSKGLLDIYINPVHGATSVPAAAWQKLIDYLEAEGFRYGVELTDGPRKPLAAWIINPSLYRLGGISEARSVPFKTTNFIGGIMAVSDENGGIVKMDAVRPSEGGASLNVSGTPEATRILLAYPVKNLPADDGIQNLWEGYGEYRDRLLAHFQDVRFGPGLRFWVDPFINEMGLRGEAGDMIPVSKAYQVEFEAWLRRKHSDISSLSREWGLGAKLQSYEQASRVIPLWREQKGLAHVYDTSTGQTIPLEGTETALWDNVLAFRQDSIRGYLNKISHTLKNDIANVPVVVKWTANHRYLLNDDEDGFDGIGVEAYGPPSVIGPFAGAQCLSLVEQCPRSMWLITTEMQTTAATTKPDIGFADERELTAMLTALKDSGSKGFFLFGFRLSPPWTNFDLLQAPEQLDWLKRFEDQLLLEPLLADWAPRTVWFSAESPLGADIKRLEKDLWWLPRLTPAVPVTVDQGSRAYSMQDPLGEAVYVWTVGAPREVVLDVPEGINPSIHFTGIEPREARRDKNRLTIPLNRDPAIVRGLAPSVFLTREFLVERAERLQGLLALADEYDVMAGEYKLALDNARTMIKSDRLRLADSTLDKALGELQILVAPYQWVEAEAPSESNLGLAKYNPEASATRYLNLDTSMPPPLAPYSAAWPFYVPLDGDYQFWLAGSALNAPGTSPISWSLDSTSWVELRDLAPTGDAYGPGFQWTRIGLLNMKKGKHVIRIRLDGPATDGAYRFALDSLVISRQPFTPDGTRHPEYN